MLAVYILATAVGGLLVVLSAFGGGTDGDLGGDAHAEIGTDAGSDAGHGDGHAEGDTGWLPYFGLRFWSYFSAFFGVTGLLLQTFTDFGTGFVAAGAVGLGLFSGFGVSVSSRLLTISQSSSTVHGKDLLGAEGVVLLTVKNDAPGKIRCSVRGDVIDLLALTSDDQPIPPGREVVVVGHEGHRVTVVLRDSLLTQATSGSSQTEPREG